MVDRDERIGVALACVPDVEVASELLQGGGCEVHSPLVEHYAL